MTTEETKDAEEETKEPQSKSAEEKTVDEEWKEEAAKEKARLQEKLDEQKEAAAPEDQALPPPTFLSFISGFAAQVLIQLGEIENPLSGKAEPDFVAARYAIDTLSILKEKTKGNLTTEEEKYFDAMLSDLRLRYVRTQEGGPAKPNDTEKEA